MLLITFSFSGMSNQEVGVPKNTNFKRRLSQEMFYNDDDSGDDDVYNDNNDDSLDLQQISLWKLLTTFSPDEQSTKGNRTLKDENSLENEDKGDSDVQEDSSSTSIANTAAS